MKGKRGHKSTGGENDAAEDEKDSPKDRTAPNKVASEAEEKKHGGRTKRAHGGKSEMKVEGHKGAMHAGRKPRKSGGRTGSDSRPLTSSHSGTNPKGRELMSESLD
jgi:hypothetical protein